jgi:oligosaccharide repeat unit polymerase
MAYILPALGLIAISGAILLATLVTYRYNLFHPLFLFSGLLLPFFFLRPILLLLFPDFHAHSNFIEITPSLPRLIFIAQLLFLTWYLVSLYTFRRVNISIPKKNFTDKNIRIGFGLIVCLPLIFTMLLVTFRLYLIAGSLDRLILMIRTGGYISNTIVLTLPEISSFIASLFVYISLKREKNGFAIIFFLIIATSAAISLMWGDRSGMIMALFAVITPYHFHIKKIRLRLALPIAIISTLLLILTAEIRSGILAGEPLWTIVSDLSLNSTSILNLVTHSVNATSYDTLLVVIWDEAYTGFSLFYRGIVGVIPRAIWTGKPDVITSGVWFVENYLPDSSSGGRPITAIGSWWVSFRILGVIIAGILNGIVLKLIWSLKVQHSSEVWITVLYTMVFFRVTSFGRIHQMILSQLVLFVLPYAFVILMSRTKIGKLFGKKIHITVSKNSNNEF